MVPVALTNSKPYSRESRKKHHSDTRRMKAKAKDPRLQRDRQTPHPGNSFRSYHSARFFFFFFLLIEILVFWILQSLFCFEDRKQVRFTCQTGALTAVRNTSWLMQSREPQPRPAALAKTQFLKTQKQLLVEKKNIHWFRCRPPLISGVFGMRCSCAMCVDASIRTFKVFTCTCGTCETCFKLHIDRCSGLQVLL